MSEHYTINSLKIKPCTSYDSGICLPLKYLEGTAEMI